MHPESDLLHASDKFISLPGAVPKEGPEPVPLVQLASTEASFPRRGRNGQNCFPFEIRCEGNGFLKEAICLRGGEVSRKTTPEEPTI